MPIVSTFVYESLGCPYKHLDNILVGGAIVHGYPITGYDILIIVIIIHIDSLLVF